MDTRTRIDKLRAMAAEDSGATTGERDNALRILANMGAGIPPRRLPTAVGASGSFDDALERTRRQFRDAQERAMRDERMRSMLGRRFDMGDATSSLGTTNTGYIHVRFNHRDNL